VGIFVTTFLRNHHNNHEPQDERSDSWGILLHPPLGIDALILGLE